MAKPLGPTVSAFARRLGVDEGAVRKAIRTGRLERGVGRDANGRTVILDIAMAEREWHANRDPSKARGGRARSRTVASVRRRLIEAQARKLELANAQRAGELVPSAEVQQDWSVYIIMCKTKLLGLPTLAKQRLPHLTVADVAVLDTLVRDALTELSDARDGHNP